MTKLKTVAALAVIIALGVTACTSSPASQQESEGAVFPSEVPKEIAPIIDRQTGTVMPGSSKFETDTYYTILAIGVERDVINTCITQTGYLAPLQVFRPPSELFKVRVALGPWLVEHAETYAFVPPQPLADLLANGLEPETVSEEEVAKSRTSSKEKGSEHEQFLIALETPEYKAAREACAQDPEVMKWQELDVWAKQSGPWQAEFQADRQAATNDPRMKQIKQEFNACLVERNLEPKNPESTDFSYLFEVVGQDFTAIDEQQVRLALEVVACKDEIQAVDRFMEIWAQYEAVTYKQYEAELQEAFEHVQFVQTELDQYLATRKK